jgi:copper ion binding protein
MAQIKTLRVGGMTCVHCAAKVTTALKQVTGVSNVKVNLMAEEAEVMLQASVTEDAFKQAVINAGYQYLGSK